MCQGVVRGETAVSYHKVGGLSCLFKSPAIE